jgi:alpha-D-xyloside xylohydrolase
MNKSIQWATITAPLDVRDVFNCSQYIRRWVSWKTIPGGLLFECQMSGGTRIEYRVDVVQPDVIRLRWNTDEVQERASDMLVKDALPTASFIVSESDDALTLATSRLRLEFPRNCWGIRAYDSDGRLFFSERNDDRAYGPGFEVPPSGFDENCDWAPGTRLSVAVRPGESFYGLGEKFTSLDKWGQEHTLWAIDSGNVSSYRSYKNVPLLLSSQGYGLFVHDSHPMIFRMGSESNITYSVHLAAAQFDAFLILGPQFKHILARYTELTGRAPMPPKWSFGFWISRAGYRSRAEVEAVIADMRASGFPCDVLSLDPWWQGIGPWCTYEWDEENFPKPADMMAQMRARGIRTCLWITPYLPDGTPIYAEAAEKGYLIRKPDGAPAPVLEAFSGEVELGAIDFTNPEAKAWWQEKLSALMDMGVAVFKTDFSEQAPVEAIYADGRSGLEMHNLYPLLYNRAVFELSQQKNGRGLVWGRAGYAGSQRYPVQWGGDSYSTLDQLSSQLRGLLSYGLSGVPFCSHDVGGFDYSPHFFDDVQHVDFNESYDPANKDGYPKDDLVYIRWLQVGVFSSHVRAHGKQSREPCSYCDETAQIAHRYLELRYRLLPYIYTQAAQSCRNGLPMVRPMALEFQDDPTTQRLDTQYMFGDDFLVAPVLSADHAVQVYLPKGKWVDYWSKKPISGGKWLSLTAPLDILPLWVRSGAIIPYGPAQDYVGQKQLDPLTIELYAPSGGRELLIEDEDLPAIPIRYKRRGKTLTVTVGKVPHASGQAAGRHEIVVYGLQAVSARCNGQDLPLYTPLSEDGKPVSGVEVRLDGRHGVEVVFGLA